jgi:hypothetical protein
VIVYGVDLDMLRDIGMSVLHIEGHATVSLGKRLQNASQSISSCQPAFTLMYNSRVISVCDVLRECSCVFDVICPSKRTCYANRSNGMLLMCDGR